jgi:hypothetical protein
MCDLTNTVEPIRGLFEGSLWHLVVTALAFSAGVFLENLRFRGSKEERAARHSAADAPTMAVLVEAATGAREGLTYEQLLARLKRVNKEHGYPIADSEVLEILASIRPPR